MVAGLARQCTLLEEIGVGAGCAWLQNDQSTTLFARPCFWQEGKESAGSTSKALPPCEIGPDAVNYRETVHHGPVSSPLCMAVDPVQGLVAVGGEDGSIKVWGRRGVERKLKSRSPGGVSFAPTGSNHPAILIM